MWTPCDTELSRTGSAEFLRRSRWSKKKLQFVPDYSILEWVNGVINPVRDVYWHQVL